mgnify:FL=1
MNFEELYKNAELETEIDVQIIRTGSLLKPIDSKTGGKYE